MYNYANNIDPQNNSNKEGFKCDLDKQNIDDFIFTNFVRFIHMMILTILLNTLNVYLDPSDITCWDVQNVLLIINNIKNFIPNVSWEAFQLYQTYFKGE